MHAVLQANAQGILQHADGASAAQSHVDAQQLKLARFWLQNAHKLAATLPTCVDLHADRLITAVAALHACSAAAPGGGGALPEGYAAALQAVSQYLVPRCRTCCVAALDAMPAAAMHNTLRELCTCGSRQSVIDVGHVSAEYLTL